MFSYVKINVPYVIIITMPYDNLITMLYVNKLKRR